VIGPKVIALHPFSGLIVSNSLSVSPSSAGVASNRVIVRKPSNTVKGLSPLKRLLLPALPRVTQMLPRMNTGSYKRHSTGFAAVRGIGIKRLTQFCAPLVLIQVLMIHASTLVFSRILETLRLWHRLPLFHYSSVCMSTASSISLKTRWSRLYSNASSWNR
jgi:hypothetical protein